MDLDEVSTPIRLSLLALADAIRNVDKESLERLKDTWNKSIDKIDELQDRCLREIALGQPFGKEFRRLAALMKISTSLERIARYITHSAEYALLVIDKLPKDILSNIARMASLAEKEVSDAIAAFIHEDERFLERSRVLEEELDRKFEETWNKLLSEFSEKCDVPSAVYSALMARNLERIGDHAVEIMRWSEYYLRGDKPWKS